MSTPEAILSREDRDEIIVRLNDPYAALDMLELVGHVLRYDESHEALRLLVERLTAERDALMVALCASCPTCGSDDPKVRLDPCHDYFGHAVPDAWHGSPKEGDAT